MKSTSIFLATMLATTFLVAAPQPSWAQTTAGQKLDDTTIIAKTKAALIENAKVAARDINIEIHKGRVQLAGFLGSEAEKQAALATARGISGVVEVLDALVVLPGSRSVGQTVDDSGLSARLKSRMLEMQGIEKTFAINTEVRRGEVILSGFVPSATYSEQAGKIAADVGAAKVHNFIALKK